MNLGVKVMFILTNLDQVATIMLADTDLGINRTYGC